MTFTVTYSSVGAGGWNITDVLFFLTMPLLWRSDFLTWDLLDLRFHSLFDSSNSPPPSKLGSMLWSESSSIEPSSNTLSNCFFNTLRLKWCVRSSSVIMLSLSLSSRISLITSICCFWNQSIVYQSYVHKILAQIWAWVHIIYKRHWNASMLPLLFRKLAYLKTNKTLISSDGFIWINNVLFESITDEIYYLNTELPSK